MVVSRRHRHVLVQYVEPFQLLSHQQILIARAIFIVPVTVSLTRDLSLIRLKKKNKQQFCVACKCLCYACVLYLLDDTVQYNKNEACLFWCVLLMLILTVLVKTYLNVSFVLKQAKPLCRHLNTTSILESSSIRFPRMESLMHVWSCFHVCCTDVWSTFMKKYIFKWSIPF